MKLPKPFIRLPLSFDVERLRAEVRALPIEAWSKHPTGYAGNSAVRLISLDGEENDAMAGGRMDATTHLRASPYIQQVLASFGSVWSRSRLMKLQPGATVPEHADINYHWFTRVRIHIPIDTLPDVRFHCGGQNIHMAAGEAWIFDNWRTHKVENFTNIERIHLVADTTGSAGFWRMVDEGLRDKAPRQVPYVPGRAVQLAFERYNTYPVLPPAEVDQLMRDLIGEAAPAEPDRPSIEAMDQLNVLLDAFCRDWRQLWGLHADSAIGVPHFLRLLDAFRKVVLPIAEPLKSKTNGTPMMKLINARLQFAVDGAPESAQALPATNEARSISAPQSLARPAAAFKPFTLAPSRPRIDRPVIIVAAPRSGSTALFETLACSPQLWTVGGEAHWLVEGIEQLRPGAPGIDSNRLGGESATAPVIEAIQERLLARLVDSGGVQVSLAGRSALRILEKTPKNALRIPFFERVFPDAQYVFLWRDPRENISSIIEAWRSGRWVTYRQLDGWDGPWSLLLPPNWNSLRGKSVQEIASFQWARTNATIMDDLLRIPASRRQVVRYGDFVADPGAVISRVCRFAGIEFDPSLASRTSAPLPPSRHTLTAPQPEKWRANADLIEPLLPALTPIWQRLQEFDR